MQIFASAYRNRSALHALLLACLLALPIVPASAGDLWLENDYLGVRFPYPARFIVGKFKPDPLSREVEASGGRSMFSRAVVLVEPDQLGKYPLDAIPVGEVPVLALDVIQGAQLDFYRGLFKLGKEIRIGAHTVHRLPGFPGPYGDQGHYYLVPLGKGNRILEITAHRYYFRDENPADPKSRRETGYDRVVETLLANMTLLP